MNRIALPLPEPSQGVDAYANERAACLGMDARKRENFMLYHATQRRSATVDYLPIKLDIENVSRCNFKCTMCAVAGWKKGKRADDMSLECFKRLIDEQYGLVEIKLNGLGEALMQGDDYYEMIRYARARRIWVRMTTNASLLGVNDNYKKLADSGVNEIDISIDGADAETFEAIRVGGSFKHVIKNCKQLNDYLGKPRSKMWTLVQTRNAHNLKAHVTLARQLGFKQLVFSLSLHGWGDDALAKKNDAATFDLTDHEMKELIVMGNTCDVRVAFWDVADKFTREKLCPWPFERAVVTSDSRVTPCCMIGDPDALEISGGKSFAEIWRGSDYTAFRRMHIQGIIPNVCKGCYKLDGGK